MKGIKNKTIGVFQHHTNATKRTTPCGLRYSCIILVGPCSRLKCAKLFFFLLFVGLLVCLLVAVFCHGLVVFVVLGAKMGVVVCLVDVFLVVLGAVWNVVASWFLRTTRVFHKLPRRSMVIHWWNTCKSRYWTHRIQRQQQRWYGTTTNSCSFVFILRSGRHSVVWVTQKIHYNSPTKMLFLKTRNQNRQQTQQTKRPQTTSSTPPLARSIHSL